MPAESNHIQARAGIPSDSRFREVALKARLIVEVDGDTHSTEAELEHDRRRDQFLRSLGWRVLRVTNEDVFKALDVVMEAIARELPD